MSVTTLPDLNLLPAEALKALVLVQHEQLLWRESEIEHLKLLLAKLQRMQFGRKSEKLARQIEQLELRLEDLQSKPAESASQPESKSAATTPPLLINTPAKPTRRPLPEHLPRQTQTHAPKESACPDCGGALCKLGEDVSEMLEYMPASFFVVRHVRPKLSCTKCDHIVQAWAPSRPIERGVAGPGLLAHVLVAKYADHLPLYRQSEIYARHGVELERSTLADWVGGTSRLLEPLLEVLRRYVTASGKLHADDTPVPVLAPGNGKTKTGRLWTYVRDDRSAGDMAAPAVWFAYSPDRKGEHPERHLQEFRGTLQADAYAGFHQLYENGRIQEAACWAHVRRKFFDLQQAPASPIGERGPEANRSPIRDRERDSRTASERAPTSSQRPCPTLARISATVVRGDAPEAFAQVGYDCGHSLRALALGRVAALFERRKHRDRQQRGGTRSACGRIGPQELLVCGIRCWRRARRGHLQLDRLGQTQRPGSGSLSARGAVAHRRPPHHSHRGVTALERRRQSAARNRTRSVKNPAAQKNSALVPASLPNIAELIAYGEITIGVLRPVGCVATASDEDRTLAMLVRRRGETLAQLLTRLDQAIDKALTEDIYTDEINPP